MKVALHFTGHFYWTDDELIELAGRTIDGGPTIPAIMIEWNYPMLPAKGDIFDTDLLYYYKEIPRELILPIEYTVESVSWAIYNGDPIPILELRGA